MNELSISGDVFSLDVEDPKLISETRRICHLYTGGRWPQCTDAPVRVTKLSGLTNYVFKVESNESHPLVLRIHGSSGGSELVVESVTAAILSERKFGPPLLGIFPEGRLEEYIMSDKVYFADIRKPEISIKVANTLARYHQLNLPVMKSQWLLLNTCAEVYSSLLPKISAFNDKQKEMIAELRSFDYMSEINFMKSKLETSKSPIVFCHNDLQEGNLLIRHDNSELVFVDYEYSCYNYRNFDIVNHFLEWVADYEVDEAPYFVMRPENFPTREQQVLFIRQYLSNSNFVQSESEINQLVEEILSEVPLFRAYSHLFWSFWGISVQHYRNEQDWGYLEYSFTRYRLYLEAKKVLLKSLSSRPDSSGDGKSAV